MGCFNTPRGVEGISSIGDELAVVSAMATGGFQYPEGC